MSLLISQLQTFTIKVFKVLCAERSSSKEGEREEGREGKEREKRGEGRVSVREQESEVGPSSPSYGLYCC